ncbi:hypothetical protein PSCLAVI8L_130785 [Pseudoclavibacter sp. 8L]|nr:hypothetical protein PSCLAVI8L_130785 [Pseudoclavibacter sp. 8L]
MNLRPRARALLPIQKIVTHTKRVLFISHKPVGVRRLPTCHIRALTSRSVKVPHPWTVPRASARAGRSG